MAKVMHRFRIDRHLIENLRDLAKKRGTTVSEILREGVRNILRRNGYKESDRG